MTANLSTSTQEAPFPHVVGDDRTPVEATIPFPQVQHHSDDSPSDDSPYAVTLGADGTPLWDGYVSDRDRELRRAHGLKLANYEAMFEAQGGKCAICGKAPKQGRPLLVDHDHDPPHEIRGLLCKPCNTKLTRGVVRYLTNPPARKVGPFFTPEAIEQDYQRRIAMKANQPARRNGRKRTVTVMPTPAASPDRFHAGPVPKIGARP